MIYFPEHIADQSLADHLFLNIKLKSFELLLIILTITSLISLLMNYSF